MPPAPWLRAGCLSHSLSPAGEAEAQASDTPWKKPWFPLGQESSSFLSTTLNCDLRRTSVHRTPHSISGLFQKLPALTRQSYFTGGETEAQRVESDLPKAPGSLDQPSRSPVALTRPGWLPTQVSQVRGLGLCRSPPSRCSSPGLSNTGRLLGGPVRNCPSPLGRECVNNREWLLAPQTVSGTVFFQRPN